jgi:methionine-rich copper-binding protein CopC
MLARWALGPALGLTVLLAGHVASAHALLDQAVPPVGGTVAKAPADVTIVFSETVEPAFSSIAVTDAAGNRVDTGKAQTVSGDAKRLAVGVKPLSPGTYTVTWHATSTDTHRTQGHFSFTVAK